jgi:hypothetical protein
LLLLGFALLFENSPAHPAVAPALESHAKGCFLCIRTTGRPPPAVVACAAAPAVLHQEEPWAANWAIDYSIQTSQHRHVNFCEAITVFSPGIH